MERSIDLLATPNWLCSAHRTEILILIPPFSRNITALQKTKPSQSGLTQSGSLTVAKFNKVYSQGK